MFAFNYSTLDFGNKQKKLNINFDILNLPASTTCLSGGLYFKPKFVSVSQPFVELHTENLAELVAEWLRW